MDSLKRITVLLLAAALVYAGAAALHPPQARAGINAGVIVNNPGSQPVPVSGNVGINNSPTVHLASGTTVGVTGGTFNFSNTPSTPVFTRDKDNPVLTPFQIRLCDGQSSIGDLCQSTGPSSYTVGASQRLVIEYVSVQCSANNNLGWSVRHATVFTVAGGTGALYTFVPGQPDDQGESFANQQTRIYADPGKVVQLVTDGIPNFGNGGHFTCEADLSGYLATP